MMIAQRRKDDGLYQTRADISLLDYHANDRALAEGLRFANGAGMQLSEALNDETLGYFPQTSLEQIIRSVLQQLLDSGATLPQPAPAKQAVVSIAQNKSGPIPADLGLTPRETEVLRVLAQGKSNKEIGRVLNIAESTVKIHTRAVCGKLNVARRAEAIVAVNRMGLVLEAS